MATVLNKPDALNLSGNLNTFILFSEKTVSFVLKKGSAVLLRQSYEPDTTKKVVIDVKEVVEGELSYTLNAAQTVYTQPSLFADFTATIDSTDYNFRVIRCGVASLADTAANWLKLHFLSWQPKVKPVTYYSPEWLTYYAVESCSIQLKANFADKTSQTTTLTSCSAGSAVTCNLQFAVMAGKFGNKYPSFYEIWAESSGGRKLTESQFYQFSDVLSEDEQWYLFENSLGGLDTFRAYGTNNLNAEHEHMIAEIGDVRQEYEVDTDRKYTKNTGYLDEYARRWMLDFFPSQAKYIHEATAIRKIVVTESNVSYTSSDIPSSYTFTYQLAEVSPYLNLIRNENELPSNLVIPDIDSPDFILPPRLAELPRVQLTEGVLIPAFDPHDPMTTVTSFGAIHDTIKNSVVKELEDELEKLGQGSGPGEGGSDIEIIKTNDFTIETDENVYSAARAKLEHEKKITADENKYIRKDKVDRTDFRVDFKDGITVGEYVGGFLGDGTILKPDGHIEATSLSLREFLEVPELRFNRIDVVSGELWNSIAFGLIESVDETNHIATLHLEDGELSGLHVNDFCRGIFHNLTGDETTPGTDSSGFDVMVGFRTSYFTPTEIIDNGTFRYELKAGSTVHPCKAMKFAVYGNPVDKNRQASAYHTRAYTRYLRGVNTWKIEEKHISMQMGDLSNLIINGEQLDEGSVYLNNVYFGGNIWYTPEQKEDMKGNDAYSVTLSTYSAVYNIADGIYEQVDVTTGNKNVTTGLSQVVASQFNVSTKLQVSKGPEPLRYSEIIGAGKYIVTSKGVGCEYIITDGLVAVKNVTVDKAEVTIEVNCEGIAVYEVVFTIVRVADGKDGKNYEYIYSRTATEIKPLIPDTSQTDDYIPKGWTDDPIGPTLLLQFEWVCKRVKIDGVWRDYSIPALWSRFGEDGTDYEYIYRRTSTESKPSTPATLQSDDYVPSGWTDDPIGPTRELPYEWISKRSKVDAAWGEFTIPSLWSRFSEDGKEQEFIYKRTTSYSTPTTPDTSQTDDYVPYGWTDNPAGVSSTYVYEWMSSRSKAKGVWGNFSAPALWAKYSFDGENGKPGIPGVGGRSEYTVYRRSDYQPSTPSGTEIPPSGWALDPPSGSFPLWASKAIFNGDGTMFWSWSTPVRITGDTGKPGIDGTPGPQGSTGPAITYRGIYSSLKQYTGSPERVDVIKEGSYWYIAKTTAGVFLGQYPGIDTTYWKRLQGQFESLATGLLIADEANISGWRFRSNYIESQNNNVVLDGNADSGPRIALGASYANRNSAPLRMYEDGRAVIKKGEIGGFNIDGLNLKATKMNIAPEYGILFDENQNKFARMGTDVLGGSTGGAAQLAVCNSSLNSTNSGYRSVTVAIFGIGAASTISYPQTWIACTHNNEIGWGSEFVVQSRYFGDDHAMERTCMNVGAFMTKGQLVRLTGGKDIEEHIVKYDNNSKYFYI